MMQDTDEGIEAPRRRHVYGRRRGKRLRAHQAGLVENLLPEISIPLSDENASPLDPATLFSPPKS
ncbi:MAG: tRNA (guanosine(46)-N7)-methyltransferase TrmB, partial [Parvibaculum sp.]